MTLTGRSVQSPRQLRNGQLSAVHLAPFSAGFRFNNPIRMGRITYMPRKLMTFGALMALVLGVFGLAGRGADAAIQSFCTHVGAPALGTCLSTTTTAAMTATDPGAPVDLLETTAPAGDPAISSTETTANVSSTAGWPATGTIAIDTELMTYSGITATSFTGLTRGAQSTVPAAHNAGAGKVAAVIPVASTAGFGLGGGNLAIDAEHIYYSSAIGNNFVVSQRAADGTTAAAHLSGATVAYSEVAIDWYLCFETGAAVPAGPVGPAPYTCGANTSDTVIPTVGDGVTKIDVWQVIKVPPGSRLTAPVSFAPQTWGSGVVSAGDETGQVSVSIDLFCDGSRDIVSNIGTGGAPWPGGDWGSQVRRQSMVGGTFVDGDPATGADNAYVNVIRPMPAAFGNYSLDRAFLVQYWLGGLTPVTMPPTIADVPPGHNGWSLQNLSVTSPYGTHPRVTAPLIGAEPNPPDNRFMCLQSPQDSVSMTNYELVPTTAGWYPRWALFTSDKDLVDGQRTRILDVQCIRVGTPASPDSDGDCLSDADEATAGTNSGVADSDGDGVLDGVEVAAGMNPLTDGVTDDGVDDYTEMFQYTNPASPDTDGD
ncbi:MAG: hypothetical protein HY874_05630, partial [Chloroflexi bacterium]|nr:hypothetical protein [Chloroflexota bacterium]